VAENETLDLGHARNGRWRKWRDSIMSKGSIKEIANEGVRCLARTFKNLQQIFENKNGVPLKEVLNAATGSDGDFDHIMRRSRFGRDYLQMFESQSNQGLDDRTILENILTLTTDRFLSQIHQDAVGTAFDDARAFREFVSGVNEQMIDGIQRLAAQMADAPDCPLRMPEQSQEQKDQHQDALLGMSIAAPTGVSI
jgi:hypothetical protein